MTLFRSDDCSSTVATMAPLAHPMPLMKQFIGHIVHDPILNAQFLHTLSFLEYIGARKILKSQNEKSITLELLAHISEEIRHAQVLKKLALKLSQGRLTSYSDQHLLCGPQARAYIQSVDRAAIEEFDSPNSNKDAHGNTQGSTHKNTHRNPWINYLYTTFLLEERAKVLYPLYDQYLDHQVFKGIMKEEETHLQDICEELGLVPAITENHLDQLRKRESEAFTLFAESLLKEVLLQKSQR